MGDSINIVVTNYQLLYDGISPLKYGLYMYKPLRIPGLHIQVGALDFAAVESQATLKINFA